MYQNLPQENQQEGKDILSKQIAMYSEFTKAVNTIYSECLSPDGEIIAEPDMEKIDRWRNKLHSFLDQCDQEWNLLVETNISKSKKKSKKKRFKKIQENPEFYKKHVWPNELDPEVFVKQLEFIMRDDKGERTNSDDDHASTEYSDDR